MLNFDANIDYTEVTPTTPTGRQTEVEADGRRGRGEQEAACGWDYNKSTFGRQSVSRKLKHFTRPDVDKLEPSLGSWLSIAWCSVVQCSGCSGNPPLTPLLLSPVVSFQYIYNLRTPRSSFSPTHSSGCTTLQCRPSELRQIIG